MEDFIFYINYGIRHVLDINAYDHMLFLIVLAVPFLFSNWKRVLILVSIFTLGHTLSLILASYKIILVSAKLVEFLIPLSIIILALKTMLLPRKAYKSKKNVVAFSSTLVFGLAHGFGFAREFVLLIGGIDEKLVPLLEFALGIEIAQLIIVFLVLFISYIVQVVFRVPRRDWILVVSSIVFGLVLPILIKNNIF